MIYKGNAKIRESGSYGIYYGSNPIGAVYHGSDKVYIFKKKTTWQAGTTLQAYQVSPYCTKIRVDCVGSQGHNSYGGKGGRVQCEMTVTPNQVLYISVGAMNNDYNAADIRTNNSGLTNSTSLNSRLIVAGGGGRAGWSNATGGAGGGLTAGNGSNTNSGDSHGGGGGTQTAGGARGGHGNVFGENGAAGSFGLGAKRSGGGAGTGSGGAGWYGGGSGGAGWYVAGEAYRWGAGGGGSSYTNSSCSNVTHTQGYRNGAGYITITEIE
jgi:hypothetical protein